MEKDVLLELLNELEPKDIDFTVGDYRYISACEIDKIQQDELADDEYMLGNFNASFLSGVMGIDMDVITALQDADAYTALGKLIISMGKLAELQEEYASADGYGAHFAPYDNETLEITIGAEEYFCFRIN